MFNRINCGSVLENGIGNGCGYLCLKYWIEQKFKINILAYELKTKLNQMRNLLNEGSTMIEREDFINFTTLYDCEINVYFINNDQIIYKEIFGNGSKVFRLGLINGHYVVLC